jgi:DHA1 family inner membrane transport protein
LILPVSEKIGNAHTAPFSLPPALLETQHDFALVFPSTLWVDPVIGRAAGAPPGRLPLALYALTAGSFGIGCAEFVIMGLLLQVSADLGVTIAAAGMLVSGYALGVFAGAPVLTLLTRRMPRKNVLMGLMILYTIGNAACALAPDYTTLMVARVVTSLTHGTFFGVGAVVATGLVPANRRASAISIMFSD